MNLKSCGTVDVSAAVTLPSPDGVLTAMCAVQKRASWWESYRSSAGSVILYDSSDCTGAAHQPADTPAALTVYWVLKTLACFAGRNSGKMPSTTPNLWAIAFASKGGQKQELQRPGRAMQFIPTASIESFQLCQEQVPTRGP